MLGWPVSSLDAFDARHTRMARQARTVTRGRPHWRRPAGRLAAAAAVLITLLLPNGHLACPDDVMDRSPDGVWTLSLCTRPVLFAMPGQGSDAPAWIVLRDAAGYVRGVSALDMVQNYGASGTPPRWDLRQVRIPLTVDMPLPPARSRLRRWLEDRAWRFRALTGLTTRSEDFR